MFSRAAKSVVKSFGSRRIHIGEKNFKIALIDGAGEISQTLSQLLRNSAKLNTVALYDVTVVNKPLPNFYNEQPFEQPIPSEMLTTAKKSCSGEDGSTAVRQTENSNHQGNDGRNQIEKLVEALYRLPIAEEVPEFNSPLIPIEELMPKLREENLTVRLGESEKIGEQAVSGRVLRLGEPDCGEDPPGKPKRNPCEPPKGPCQPAEPPGYPSKPKYKRKPFCVKCPPKKPCKDEKC